jgi:FkbM family methyltransferase
MFKKIIDKILGWKGYEITRIQNLDTKVESGEYRWLQDLKIKTVLDVGANAGRFATMINKILPGVKIYSFEPIKDCFEILKQLEKSNHNLKTFNFALGNKSGEQTIFKNEFLPSSSLLSMAESHKNIFPYTRESKPETINIKTLDSISDEIEFLSRVLLKVDVQGFELEVLKGAKESLKSIEIIIIETSYLELYESQPLFDDVYTFLKNSGFVYYGNFDQMPDPKTGLVLQSDAIFIKKDITLSSTFQ